MLALKHPPKLPGMTSVLAGIALGLSASSALTRLMRGFLFGLPPTDWITFALATVVLCVVALVANLAPPRRKCRRNGGSAL